MIVKSNSEENNPFEKRTESWGRGVIPQKVRTYLALFDILLLPTIGFDNRFINFILA